MEKLEIPICLYDDGKYQTEPQYDFEQMSNDLEDIVLDKLGKDICVVIKEIE
tara:strand:- start:6047 stop:6202 length:156 start_codon:yes stop_codon:yes gene_type:complete